MSKLIVEAITEHYGERCPDFDAECFCCKAWDEYDRLTRPEPTPCDELVTVAYQYKFRDVWLVSDAPKVMRKDDYELRELVTRQNAEAIIAAERAEKEKLEAAWLEAEGIISDLKAELAEALRGNRYAQLERIAVQRAEKAEADNKRLREALDFYASKGIYKRDGWSDRPAPAISDGGKKARAALGEVKP